MLRSISLKGALLGAIIFYLILISATIVSSLILKSPKMRRLRENYVSQLNKQISSIMESPYPPFRIFLNNLALSTLMSIPYLGVAFFTFLAINTGVMLGALIAHINETIAYNVIGLLFLPHGILESVAYGTALYLAVKIRSLKKSLLALPLIASLLGLAAIIEYAEILLFHQLFKKP